MEILIQGDERVIAIVCDALQRPVDKREEFLRAQCREDEKLYRAASDALQWEERMGAFLLEPMVDLTSLMRPFEPGQVIAERFEIVREIGEGGMGVVYEAQDRKRQQRVAIKAAKPGFQRLLSPELEGALKVRHHNICLVNEIHTAETEYGEIDFLTMEFLEGETLSDRLAKVGKLAHKEALDISCQLCAGLAEAHHSGIIHRDLKSGNVLLCRNEDGSTRAVITDFGLAGRADLASGEIGGTPDYMSPELWNGGTASKTSDIYALGVILYEMVAGRKPHDPAVQQEKLARVLHPDTGITAAHARERMPSEGPPRLRPWLTKDWWRKRQPDPAPAPPSAWTHPLDPRWDRVIMRCLAASPTQRPQDVDEVLAELKRQPIPKWPFVSAALLLLVLAALITFVRPIRQRVMDFVWPPNVRLAVLPFDGPKNLTTVGAGTLQDLTERVQQLPSDRKWPLNKLSRNVALIPPSRTLYLHVDTPQKARDLLHATHALKVTLQPEGGKLMAHASIIDLTSQLPVKELLLEYEEGNLGAISAALTHFVAMTFGLREPSSEDKLSSVAMQPYLQGIYFLNRDIHSFDEAIAKFQEAARLDPSSALPPAGIAQALVQKSNEKEDKSYLNQAQEFVSIAQSRNPDSVRVLLASARVNIATARYTRALQDYRRILELEPRNVDALLGMGIVYEDLDETQEAINAFRKAQELDPEYYRSYQLLGEFYGNLGRYNEAAEEFRKAVARAPGFFDGYSSLGAMLIGLNRLDEAEQALKKSLSIRESPMALNNLGALMVFQHRFDEAAELQKRALVYQPHSASWLLNLADDLRWAGHPAEALVYYRQAKQEALARMTAEPNSAYARALFAYFSARLGEKDRADEEIQQALNLAASDNDILRRAIMTYEALGERDRALEASKGLTLAELKELIREPDLADLCQDPRFKEEITAKGGY